MFHGGPSPKVGMGSSQALEVNTWRPVPVVQNWQQRGGKFSKRGQKARVSTRFPASERIVRVVVKSADTVAVEPLLVDLERAADEELGRQFLDGVFDRFGGTLEARIAHRPLSGLARAGVKLGGSSVIERTHKRH